MKNLNNLYDLKKNKKTRQINLGQCLPKSCEVDDIRKLLAQEKSQATSLSVIDVRPIPGSYTIFKDVKFHIIG